MHRRRRMLVLLVLGVVGTALFVGCGETPPAAYWNWSAADSTQIMTIVDHWKDTLRTRIQEDESLSDPVGTGAGKIPDTTTKVLRKSMRDKKYRPASYTRSFFFPRNFYRTFDSLQTVDSVIVTKDTTVTIRLNEYFWGHFTILTDSTVNYRLDTTINGMAFKAFDTTFTYTPVPETVVTPCHGWSERFLEFEPVDKTKRDVWVLKRVSGGARVGMPDDVNAPFLYFLQFATTTVDDTIWQRPDSSQLGVQRLYSRDSLLSFAVGESVATVLTEPTGVAYWDPQEIVPFLHLPDPTNDEMSVRRLGRPVQALNFVSSFRFATPGLKQVGVELIPISSLTEPVASITSRVWDILVDIK